MSARVDRLAIKKRMLIQVCMEMVAARISCAKAPDAQTTLKEFYRFVRLRHRARRIQETPAEVFGTNGRVDPRRVRRRDRRLKIKRFVIRAHTLPIADVLDRLKVQLQQVGN